MVDIGKITSVYFIGIGGIGMSALARYFHFHGKSVSGYDKTETALTKQLVEEGISIHYTDDISLAAKDPGLVVYTPAVPADHKELNWYKSHDFPILKRSEVLGAITESSFNICVGGTHGKTTVTTMIAHILRHSGYGCNAFLGGISVNYNSNFWSDKRNVCVVEADEYDRSFLRLHPDVAVITAMDPDHLDIYGTPEAVEDAFVAFAGQLKQDGLLFYKYGLTRSDDLQKLNHKTYAFDDERADVYAENITVHEGSYWFDVVLEGKLEKDVVLHMGGLHNIENAVVAIAVADQLGIDGEKIKAAIEDFKGIKRRFEYVIKEDELVFIDDYAHHPEELKALINGAKGLYKNLRSTVIFQPHLFSRTKDLAEGFAESLSLADEVILLPIYPAREKPMPGVDSRMIASKIPQAKVTVLEKNELLEEIASRKENGKAVELLITAGAGDIDALVEPIKNILHK